MTVVDTTQPSGGQSLMPPPATARPVALTIAGFDPVCGAGITADLKVFAAHDLYGVAAITALTVQSTQGVRRNEPVEADLLRQTLECLRDDVKLSGVKIGMLGDPALVGVVAEFLGGGQSALPSLEMVVLDPVMLSTSGGVLLNDAGIERLRRLLLGRVGWITPNRAELQTLTGHTAQDQENVAAGARLLQTMAREEGNPRLSVIVTGGDLERPDDYLLTAAGEEHWLQGEHIHTRATHGTGCAFSTALLCSLMAGYPAYEAAVRAKAYVVAALKAAYPVGQGKGPMHHLYRLDERE